MKKKIGIDQIVDFPKRKDSILDLFYLYKSIIINK